MKDTTVEILAALIHKRKCRLNHIEQCSWDYSSWEAPCSTRLDYLNKAKTILEKVDFETAYSALCH